MNLSRAEAYKEGMELLHRVGMADKTESFPDELSGGQKQRVAIARAIAMKPEILLFDEPTSTLDPSMIAEVLYVIRELADQGMTMLIVTHEMKFARDVSNRIFYMDEGGIYEEGSPEQIFEHPVREKTRQFIKHLKTLDIEIASAGFDYAALLLKIEEFCKLAMLDVIARRNLMLIFEEVVAQSLAVELGRHREGLPLSVHMEYSAQDGQGMLRFCWGGREYDPVTASDELSVRIVTKLARAVSYRYEGANILEINI